MASASPPVVPPALTLRDATVLTRALWAAFGLATGGLLPDVCVHGSDAPANQHVVGVTAVVTAAFMAVLAGVLARPRASGWWVVGLVFLCAPLAGGFDGVVSLAVIGAVSVRDADLRAWGDLAGAVMGVWFGGFVLGLLYALPLAPWAAVAHRAAHRPSSLAAPRLWTHAALFLTLAAGAAAALGRSATLRALCLLAGLAALGALVAGVRRMLCLRRLAAMASTGALAVVRPDRFSEYASLPVLADGGDHLLTWVPPGGAGGPFREAPGAVPLAWVPAEVAWVGADVRWTLAYALAVLLATAAVDVAILRALW